MSATIESSATDTDRIAFELPETLSSPQSKLVYLCLAASGGATVDELHEALDLRKITLFPVLETLTDRDVVTRDGETYVPVAS